MRVNAKFNAEIGSSMKVVFSEAANTRIATISVAFTQDRPDAAKRFGKEFSDFVFAGAHELQQANLSLAEDMNPHDILWRYKTLAPQFLFEQHEVKIGALGPFSVMPEFKSVVPVKKDPKVVITLALGVLVTKTDVGELSEMLGNIIGFEFSTQMPIDIRTAPRGPEIKTETFPAKAGA